MVHSAEEWGHEQNKWEEEHRTSTAPPERAEGAGCLKIGVIGAVVIGAILYGVSEGCDSKNGSLEQVPARYEQTSSVDVDNAAYETTAPRVELADLDLATSVPLSTLVTFAPETVIE